MVRMDMLLTLCISVSLFCFYRLYVKTSKYDWLYAFLFFLSAALATLTKGPIGLGLPGLIITIFLLSSHSFRLRSKPDSQQDTRQIWTMLRKMHLFWGSLLYLTIVLAWFIPAISQRGWNYAYLIMIKQNLGRVYNSWSHARPWYFYIHTVPWITLPWFPFFISAAIMNRKSPLTPQERLALRFLWCWWGTTFIFFSLVSGKLEIYMLPLFPATALIVGKFWTMILTSRQPTNKKYRYVSYPTYMLAGATLLAPAIIMVNKDTRQYLGGALILLCFGLILIFFAWQRHTRLLFATLWSFTPIVLLYGLLNVVPTLNQQFSFQPLEEDLSRFHITAGSLAVWQIYPKGLRFFLPTHITILTTDQETSAFFSSKTPVYSFVKLKHLEQFRKKLNIPIYVLATYRIKNRTFALVSQYPKEQLIQ